MDSAASDSSYRRTRVVPISGMVRGDVRASIQARTSPRTIPLIGTTRVRRYEESLAALSIELSPEQVAALDAACPTCAPGRRVAGEVPGVLSPEGVTRSGSTCA